MSNNERTSKGGKKEEVLGEVVEIEGESNKHFETKDSSMFNNIQDVEKITKQLVGAENRTDLVNQIGLANIHNNESEILDIKKNEIIALTCSLCKKYLPSAASLEIHTRIHEFDQSIPCKIQDCSDSFTHKKRLWDHMRSAHGEDEEKWTGARYKCNHCEKIFDNKYSLKIHISFHSQEKNYLCACCPKRFKSKDSLRLHKRRHNGEANFECEHCDKRYVAATLLKAHVMAKHETSAEVFTCDHCQKEFNKKEKLKSHLTLHTGEKPFKCREGCEKDFRLPVSRENHERLHRGVMEFQCASCPKMFMRKSSLQVHTKRHEGKKEHQCALCGKDFVEPAGARNCRHSGK